MDKFTSEHIVVLGTAATIAELLVDEVQQHANDSTLVLPAAEITTPTAIAESEFDNIVQTTVPKQKSGSGFSRMAWITAGLVLVFALFGIVTVLGIGTPQSHHTSLGNGVSPHTVADEIGNPMVISPGARIDPKRVSLEGGIPAAHTQPEYPSTALQDGIQGDVVGTLLVSPTGIVDEVRISSGNPTLVAAVKSRVSHWRYSPFRLNGNAVPVIIPIRFTFRISQ